MNVEMLVKKFNSINGTRFKPSSQNLIDRFEEMERHFTEAEIYEVICNNEAMEISEIVNKNFINNYFENKKLRMELEEKKKIDIEQEETNLNLGLIEKALAKVMMEEYADELADKVHDNIDKYIKDNYGTVHRKIVYEIPQTATVVDEVVHEEFETVMKFIMADEPVMLVGPSGTGKNVICKQIAKALDLDFYFTNSVTQEYKLTGFIDANGVYHETEFYKAFKNGGIFMLDEMDASIPETLIILNAAIANRYFEFPNGKIEAHPDFRVVAAGNTFGHGASYEYSGRNQLDAASLNRFAIVEINYSRQIEDALSTDEELKMFIRDFREGCRKCGINHIVSYRELNRLEKMKNLIPLEKALKTCLIKNMDDDDVRMVIDELSYNEYKEYREGLERCVD